MNMPFYVSPEQLMKDRADFARKGIARGRSVVVLAYDGGIAFATENPSRALHKISEIYDRIGFAAVGKYNEFENLRVAGVRYADLRGYTYDRSDVTARGLANAYAQILGTVFITESKPLEVELVVAEVGRTAEDDQIYRLTYDGTVADEHGHVVMGGQAEQLGRKVGEGWRADMTLGEALRLAVTVLGSSESGTPRTIEPGQLEVAVLERSRPRRAFRRLTKQTLTELLAPAPSEAPGVDDAEGPGGIAAPQAVPAAPEKAEDADKAEEADKGEDAGKPEDAGKAEDADKAEEAGKADEAEKAEEAEPSDRTEATGSAEQTRTAEPSEPTHDDEPDSEPPPAGQKGTPQD